MGLPKTLWQLLLYLYIKNHSPCYHHFRSIHCHFLIATPIDLVSTLSSTMSPFSTVRSNSQEEHIPFEKTVSVESVDDDKESAVSHILRAEHTLEALQLVAGSRVRHARCAPEFLEEVAGAHFKKFTSKKFKIITGSEANSFFKNYIMCVHSTFDEPFSQTFSSANTSKMPHEPITIT